MRAALLSLLAVAACGGGGPLHGDAGDLPPDAHEIIEPEIDAGPDAEIADAGPPDAFFDNGETTFTATKEGDPLWETAGWEVFSAPNSVQTVEAIFGKHQWHDLGAFGPKTVHTPPYDTEVSDALASFGIDPGNDFYRSSWQWPDRGLMLLAVIVPSAGAPTGQTFDYASGPIIPDANQLYVDLDTLKDGVVIDPTGDSTYPRLSTIDPARTFDGWSHMTLGFGEDTSYIPGTPGSYEFRVHVYEVATPANGWVIDVPFTIE